ncbi:MAG: ATP-binding protein [Vulcanimicrobiota bacterium]
MKRWLPPILVLAIGLMLVVFLRLEETKARAQADQGLARLATLGAEPLLLGINEQLDLEWVRAFPQLRGLEVADNEGKVLERFGESGQGQLFTVRSAGQAIGSVRLNTAAVKWSPLPLVAVLLMTALTLASTSKPVRLVAATSPPPTPALLPENLTGSIRSALGEVGQTDAGKALARELSDQLRAGSVVLELNRDLTIRSVGGSLEGLGYARTEMVGKPITAFLKGFRPDQIEEQQASCLTKAGAPLASHVSAVPVLSPSGELEKVVVVMRDSTSGGRRVRERLGELEALHRSLCDNANDLIVSVTADGTIAYANQRWRDLTGEEESIGRTLLMTVTPKHRLGCQEYFYQALMQGRAGPFELQIQGDAPATLEGSFHLTPKVEGRPQLIMGIFRDVTSQREAEERFRHAQKMEAVGRLAGGIAHDFNNLLTIIFSYTSMLEMEAEEHEELIEYVRELRQASERAAGLTRQLLLFSRSQTDEPVVLSLNGLTRDLTRLAERLLGEKIDLQLLLEAKPDLVMGDQSQLEQVLMNLLVNARDSLNGEGRVRVQTGRRRIDGGVPKGLKPGEYVFLEVSDNGCGIPEDYLNRIFEPYFTTKIGGRGTGLGLSTVYAIVERYQGQIQVDSQLGQGTTFTVLLPAAHKSAVEANQASVEEACCQGHGQTALLVEDEEAVRSAIGTMLSRCGFRVLSARDGEEGEGMIQQHVDEIDLLVTDLVLPKRSGPEIASVYAQKKPDGKILYVSGYPADVIRDHGLPGQGAFLSKPFGVSELRSKLRSLSG